MEQHLGRKVAAAGQVNLFETTIRVLGGLLSAHHLRAGTLTGTGSAAAEGRQSPSEGEGEGARQGGRPSLRRGRRLQVRVGPAAGVFLRVAVDLADRLMAAFRESPTAVPLSDVVLRER